MNGRRRCDGHRSACFDKKLVLGKSIWKESQAPARVLILVTPPGFDRFLQEIGRPLPSFDAPPTPVMPEDIQRLLAVALNYGIEILPPPR